MSEMRVLRESRRASSNEVIRAGLVGLRNDANIERRYRLFPLARLESSTPARTCSSTPEILNFQSHPIPVGGQAAPVYPVVDRVLWTPTCLAMSSTGVHGSVVWLPYAVVVNG
jgi:hypothetical protein